MICQILSYKQGENKIDIKIVHYFENIQVKYGSHSMLKLNGDYMACLAYDNLLDINNANSNWNNFEILSSVKKDIIWPRKIVIYDWKNKKQICEYKSEYDIDILSISYQSRDNSILCVEREIKELKGKKEKKNERRIKERNQFFGKEKLPDVLPANFWMTQRFFDGNKLIQISSNNQNVYGANDIIPLGPKSFGISFINKFIIYN